MARGLDLLSDTVKLWWANIIVVIITVRGSDDSIGFSIVAVFVFFFYSVDTTTHKPLHLTTIKFCMNMYLGNL